MAVKAFKDKKPMQGKFNRTAYDLSFQNNSTFRFGRLTPIMCKEVIPGDGVRIKADFGLNFMPMVFPVQTRIYAKLYFFYVRNRAIYEGFKEFITNTPDNNEEIPYINWPTSQVSLQHGSLSDYLGVPTSVESMSDVVPRAFNTGLLDMYYVHNSFVSDGEFPFIRRVYNSSNSRNIYTFDSGGLDTQTFMINFLTTPFASADTSVNVALQIALDSLFSGTYQPVPYVSSTGSIDNVLWNIPFSFQNLSASFLNEYLYRFRISLSMPTLALEASSSSGTSFAIAMNFADGTSIVRTSPFDWSVVHTIGDDGKTTVNFDIPCSWFDQLSRTDFLGFSFCWFDRENINIGPLSDATLRNAVLSAASSPLVGEVNFSDMSLSVYDGYDLTSATWLDMSMAGSPIYNGSLKISALPFRAYESIYNAYFRNQNVDRFMINGAPKYNQFVTTKAGGADDTPYDFFNVNWERDFLTSAYPEPQQGDAPLVGVTGTGEFVFDNGDGTTSTVVPTYGDDGRLTGIGQYSPDAPESSLKRVLQYVSAGLSINDFRNTNSLQRYLEENMLHGYRYKDLMKAHYGEDIHYNELDMPEYIGGVSRIVNMDKILNNNASGDKPLGDFAGLASMFSSQENSPTISCHCDEHGFIIGLCCIMPVPVYSQVLPKHFLKHHFLDYYNPKFANIGYQPISYSEITPNEKYAVDGADGLSDTFGYQRPWYDYLGSVDEAHGLFRSQLENYVLRRKFATPPVLGHDFITLSDDSLNNVFATDAQTDKILGKIYLDITMKRIIPRFNIPRLE